MRCNGMGSYEFVMRCGWLRCHVVWFEVVVWCGDPYYKVLQVLHSTTRYYKVLLRTPRHYKALLRTTKYYSVWSSNRWNAQYNARSNRSHPPTSPNNAPATNNDSDAWSLFHMKRAVQCAEQQVWPSNLTKYCACHEKMTVMIDRRHIWKVIYIARSNRHHLPTSPNIAPATKNYSHDWSSSNMKRHWQCAEQQDSPSNVTKYCSCHWCPWHMKRHLQRAEQQDPPSNLTKYCACHANCTPKSKRNLPKTVEASFTMADDSSMIRTWSDHEIANLTPSVRKAYFSPLRQRILYWKLQPFAFRLYLPKFHQILLLPRKVTLQPHQMTKKDSHDWSASHMKRHLHCAEPHQILHLPRKITLIIDPPHIWNVIYNARSNRTHPPTSPNTAPATQNSIPKSKRNLPETVEASFTLADDSTMIRAWTRHLATSRSPWLLSALWGRICIENYNLSRCGYLPKFHQILRLERKVTLQHHQILCLPRKVTLQHHQILCLPRKVTLQQDQIVHLPRRVTELLLYWTVTLLSCYLTEVLLWWTVPKLLLDWTVTWLNCYLTELLFYWAATFLDSFHC